MEVVMIDEKKLIEDLKQQFPDWKSSSVGCIVKSTVNKLIRIIKAQPQIENCSNCSRRKFYQEGYADGLNANKWILCSERLPECDWGFENQEGLLFQLESGTIEAGFYGTGGKYRDRYFRPYRSNSEGFDVKNVVAWQPLPEPYKGD